MIAEMGAFALMLALALSLGQTALSAAGRLALLRCAARRG